MSSSSENDKIVCLKPHEIEIANNILLNVLNSLNIKEQKQRGGGDKFDILASVLIAGMVCASTFGIVWASGWIITIISSAANITDILHKNVYEACFTQKSLASMTYILKGEIGKIIKSHINSKNVQHILANHLRHTYKTFDNFAELCFSQMYQDTDP